MSQTYTSYAAQAGVMIRGGTDPGAPFYFVLMRASTGIAVQYRAVQGAPAVEALETAIGLPPWSTTEACP